MQRQTKIYIDTSVWNFALETIREDSFIVNKFFNYVNKSTTSQIYISDVVYREINDADLKRRNELLHLVNKYKPELLSVSDEVLTLADIYVDEKIIPVRYKDDAIHIAIASVSRCEFIVSCNYKHMVKAKTMRGVHLINIREGYGLIEIVTPRGFLGV